MIDKIAPKRKVRKPDLNPKQRKFVKMIAAGNNQSDAAKLAGYSDKCARVTGSRLLTNANVQAAVQSVWDKCGLSDQYIGNKVKALTEAKRVQFFAKDGIVTDERVTEDTAVQRSSIELAARLKGLLVDRSVSLNVSIDISPVDLSKYRNDDIIDV
jgi:hypothetical protein